MQSWIRPFDHPLRALVKSFIAWKILLLLIAACSPGPGYDTSTSLALSGSRPHAEAELPPLLHGLVSKLMRWDAIYFVKVANRGYLFEQEWAFGWGFTRVIALCTAGKNSGHSTSQRCVLTRRGLERLGLVRYEGLEGLVGIFIAHTAHLLSVFVLFNLTQAFFPSPTPEFAFTAAFLHILSPAGLFLSAPYAESSCALLTFSGCLLFTKSVPSKGQSTPVQDLLVLASGLVFGMATTFRSNGILNGLLLLEEALRILLQLKYGFHMATIRRLGATGLGGLSVAAGFLLPQYLAYSEYCTIADTDALRPWCGKFMPSIYTFVQEHYWYVSGLILSPVGIRHLSNIN